MDGWGEAQANRQRLALELRRLRDLAGLSGRELAQRIGISQSKVSRIESGAAIPSSPEIVAWADAVGAPAATRDVLMELTEQALTEVYVWQTGLHERITLQDDIQEQERRAGRVFTYEPSIVPGLLQTAEYARRVFSLFHPPFPERDIPAAVASRLDRQLALYEEGRKFDFLITEAALRWRPGPPKLLLAQLDRIASVSTLDNVSIGLVPQAVQAVTSTSHGFVILDGGAGGDDEGAGGHREEEREADKNQDDSIVMIETVHANLTVKGEYVAPYRHRWSLLQQMAIFDDDARAFLADVGADIQKLDK